MIRTPKSSAIEQGVTLIELLVVLAIVAVLAVMAVPSFNKYSQKTYRSKMYSAFYELAGTAERISNSRLDTLYTGADTAANALFSSKYAADLGARYNVTVTLSADEVNYHISAVPIGQQAGDGALAYFDGSVCHYTADSVSMAGARPGCDAADGEFISL